MAEIFPFTAIVGQERMKRALILNAVYPRIGGVLIRGERGTAKSTAARALAALLPPVRVIRDCRFNCDPDQPQNWCTECQEKHSKGEAAVDVITTPFINLPVSATEDRVVGTLDIEKAIQKVSVILNLVCSLLRIAACYTSMKSTYSMTMWWMSYWMLPPWASTM